MRKLILLASTALFILPLSVFSLGVGDITVKSSLNQKLSAEIALYSVSQRDLDNIRIRLGTYKEFAKAGIERPLILNSLRFSVQQKADGTPYIKVTSKDPVREPFLNFLLDIDWRTGRILREYTLLLDPPVFAGRGKAPLAAPVVTPAPEPTMPAASPAVIDKPVAQPAAPVVTPESAPAADDELFPRIDIGGESSAPAGVTSTAPSRTPAWTGENYGPTVANNTLWSIAKTVRPDDSVSMQQVMLAILEANPEAFANNNINGLKTGYVLRIPDKVKMQAISQDAALRETRLQHQMWKNIQPQQAEESAEAIVREEKKPAEEKPEAAKPAKTPETAEVKLMTPSQDTGEVAGAGSDREKRLATLRKELALAKEELGSKDQQNVELESRIADLEQQIDKMQRLLSLKDDDLARMQQNMQTETPAEAPVVPAKPEADKQQPAAVPAPQAAGTTVASAKNPYALKDVPKVEPKPKPVVKPKPVAKPKPMPKKESAGFMDDITQALMGSPAMMGIAIVIVLGLGGIMWVALRRRRMGSDSYAESILAAEGAGAASEIEPSEQTSLLSGFTSTAIEAEKAGGEVDPLAEADVFMAYKRYSQAEEMLNQALEDEPDRADLKVKLMEVYAATENRDAFEAMAQQVHDSIGGQDQALWEKVETMGRDLCPDNPLFGGVAEAAAELETEAVEEADIVEDVALTEEEMAQAEALGTDFEVPDLSSEELDITPTEEEPAEELPAMDLELETTAEAETPSEDVLGDLDLDMESMGVEETAETAEEPAPVAEDTSLDFDTSELDALLAGGTGEAAAEEAPAEEMEPASVEQASATDEVATKLDLARAYVDMGDPDGARSILDEVVAEGSDDQKKEAEELLSQL